MGLNIRVSGLRFRSGDARLSPGRMSAIVGQRLSNIGVGAVRIRQGDNPAELTNLPAMRQPSTIEVSPIDSGIVLSEIKMPEMLTIPGGTFSMGSTNYADEQPIRQVQISEFALGKYPVTNEEFGGYLRAINAVIPELVADPSKARHPVVNVSWSDATKYCQWLSENTERKFRLPTEAEWEYAARGPEGNKFPWGNEWDPSKVVFDTRGTEPVDSHPEGASWCGASHMAGNVWEWAADWYGNSYSPEDLANPKGPETGTSRVLRGGSWYDRYSDYLRYAYRATGQPEFRDSNVGFRVAEDL